MRNACLLENLIRWARTDTPFLSELLQIVDANYTNLRPTAAHGDFTELNLIIDRQQRPILIDAELGAGQNYRFYDVAEFYNRLYTRLCRPDLAAQFLKTYLDTLQPSRRRPFLNNFLCISAFAVPVTF